MSRKDIVFFALFLLLIAALSGKALFAPGYSFGNFGDIYAYHYPLRHLIVSTLQQGHLPLWNPYIFCGTPLLANPQSGVFDPLSVLFYFLPLTKAFDWNTFLRLTLGYAGAALLCRRWRLSAAGTFAMSVAFALSPFLVYRIAQGVPTLLASLAFVPWTWLALESGSAGLFGLAVGLQLLSGHPQFMAINLAGAFLILLLKRRPALATFLAGGVMGALATAGQWIPTLQFLRLSVRAHWVPLYASAYSWEPRYLLELLHPGSLGTPLHDSFRGVPSEFFEMSGLYLGLVPLGLAVWALWRGSGARAFALLAVTGLFFAFGAHNPLLRLVLDHPGFGSLRVPSRWLLLALWGVWACACAGWKELPRLKGPRNATLFPAALTLLVVLGLAPWDARFIYPQDPSGFIAPDHTLSALIGDSPYRFATSSEIQNPDKAMLYRLRNVTGYEAFYLAGAALEASEAQGKPSADGSRTYIGDYKAAGFSSAALRYFVAPANGPSVAQEKPRLATNSTLIYENAAAQPLAFHAGSTSPDVNAPRFLAAREDSWDLEETIPPGAPPLVLSQAYFPGWKAWVSGATVPVDPWQDFFQTIRLGGAPGDILRINVRFWPDLWYSAIGLSMLFLLCCAGLGLSVAHRFEEAAAR